MPQEQCLTGQLTQSAISMVMTHQITCLASNIGHHHILLLSCRMIHLATTLSAISDGPSACLLVDADSDIRHRPVYALTRRRSVPTGITEHTECALRSLPCTAALRAHYPMNLHHRDRYLQGGEVHAAALLEDFLPGHRGVSPLRGARFPLLQAKRLYRRCVMCDVGF